jgi:LysM repeat protein
MLPVAALGVLLAAVLAAGLAACSFDGQPPGPATPAAAAGTGQTDPSDGGKPPASGLRVVDSFGNVDYYTTTAGDTHAAVAGAFGVSEAKVAEFNRLTPGVPLAPGIKLRLIPPAGPITGAMGAETIDDNGIPTTYVVADEDTIGGITYRFGLTMEQLAEANKVPYVYEKGNVYFLHAGNLIQLQKNPVDSRSGTGVTLNNSFGQADYYTTVEGDSFDSLGYRFRSTTQQLLLYNPALTADEPIPAGTTVRLMPGDLKIEGAQGTFTANADGVPATYTTAPGDIERQVAFRFNLQMFELESANRPLTPGAGSWFDYADLPAGELAPGQTISLTAEQPINK